MGHHPAVHFTVHFGTNFGQNLVSCWAQIVQKSCRRFVFLSLYQSIWCYGVQRFPFLVANYHTKLSNNVQKGVLFGNLVWQDAPA